jgi:hypothetical protein
MKKFIYLALFVLLNYGCAPSQVAIHPPFPTNKPILSQVVQYGILESPFPYNEPALINETLNQNTYNFKYNFKLFINKTIRGSAALSLILKADPLNPRPPATMEPILVQVTISNVAKSEKLALTSDDFAVISNGKMTTVNDYDICCLNEVLMDELYVYLSPGGTVSGWIPSLEYIGDQKPLLVFDPNVLSGTNNSTSSLYFALPPGSQ